MTTTRSKRPLYSSTSQQLLPQWPLAKRPRYITTPTSTISIITAQDDDDASSTHHQSSVHCHLASPTYTINFSTPPTPHPLQSPPHHSPPSQASNHYTLRSDREIVADVDNSFVTSQTAPLAWNTDFLIQLLTDDIEHLCIINHRNGASGVSDQYHGFFSQYKQPFELDFYIRRLVQYSNCSTAAFIIMLIYLDRIQENCTQLLVTEMNCHRLLCTALVLAIKFLDDEVFSNAYYARVGGVTPDEMNQLELTLLNILDWNLSVSPETFSLYEEGLLEAANSLSQQHLPCSPTSAA